MREHAPVNIEAIGEIISADELDQLVRQKANILILDARPDWFYENDGHLPSALNLERAEFDNRYPALADKIAKADKVIVYCSDRDCEDSRKVAQKLRAKNHTNISLYPDGWQEWKRQGRKLNQGKQP
jgi:rhodanese-related sulfurtransferase